MKRLASLLMIGVMLTSVTRLQATIPDARENSKTEFSSVKMESVNQIFTISENRFMTTKEFKFSNGDQVKEKITGFSGTITGTCFYVTGCNQYLIAAKPKDEFSEPVSLWYDEARLNLINPSVINSEDVTGEDPGCDIPPLQGKRGS